MNSGVIYAKGTQVSVFAADNELVQLCERRVARFDPSVEQVVAARRFASRIVADAGYVHAVADVALATGELAANAAEHAGTPYDVVVMLDGCIRIEVTDGSAVLPVRGEPDLYAERGRGIALVELVGRTWGVDASTTGKTVWVEIDL